MIEEVSYENVFNDLSEFFKTKIKREYYQVKGYELECMYDEMREFRKYVTEQCHRISAETNNLNIYTETDLYDIHLFTTMLNRKYEKMKKSQRNNPQYFIEVMQWFNTSFKEFNNMLLEIKYVNNNLRRIIK